MKKIKFMFFCIFVLVFMNFGVVYGDTIYYWDFGDGSPLSYEQNPEHTYTSPGTHTVTMTVVMDGIPCSKTSTITINAGLPTITTAAVSNITSYTAESGGEVTSDGGSSVTARGVCWSTSPNPDISNPLYITTNGTGTGTFTSNISGLITGTTYYVRAYATNANGTSYGNEETFTTFPLYTISGTVTSGGSGLAGVSMGGLPGSPSTNGSGFYSDTVPFGWSGTVEPSLSGYIFTPATMSYSGVASNQVNQNYTAFSGNPVISGTVRTSGGAGISGVILAFSNGGGTATTDTDGDYTHTVISDWSGTATPSLAGYIFNPDTRSYSNVISDQSGQDYTGITGNPVISGTIISEGGSGLSGVTLTFSNGGGTVTTDTNGNYSQPVTSGWSGTITPFSPGYVFSPQNLTYQNVTSDQNNQNYTASTGNPVISGTVSTSGGAGLSGVTLDFSNGGGTVTTNANGNYSHTVAFNWSGTMTPSLAGYIFSPTNLTYTDVTSNQSNQNYTASSGNPVISGTVQTSDGTALSGVTLNFTGGGDSTVTDANGNYSRTIASGWSGTVTPSLAGFIFSPQNLTYQNVTSDQNNQKYTASSGNPIISGTIQTSGGVSISGVTLNFSNNGGTVTTDTAGNYLHTVASGWSGTVTPALTGYSFSPGSMDYSSVTSDMPNQNYLADSVSPEITLNRTQLNFGANTSGTHTSGQSFLVENSGGGTLNWTLSTDQSWLNCDPISGAGSGSVSASVDVTGLSAGTYTGTITVADAAASNSPRTISVKLKVYNATDVPFGVFSTPIDGSTVSSSIPVTGWVLDDIEVKSLKIYSKDGNSLDFIGDAVFVEGARPDVELMYPDYPMNYQAGWGYMMLTYFLPNGGNGTYTFEAMATDAEGNEVTLGTNTITVDNENAIKPFGAIDTPEQGGTASGTSYVNWGWVLTPQPNSIPKDGSTINVYVDGVNLGNPTYNIYREDIANAFPSYANSDGAVGRFYLDTTGYENGVHTIQWTATDNAGNTDGIGSRYFAILNLAGSMEHGAGSKACVSSQGGRFNLDISQIAIDCLQPVRLKKGYNHNANSSEVYPDDKGKFNIEIKELETLEIHHGNNNSKFKIQNSKLKNASYNLYAGYLLVDGKLKSLPIGSTIDIERGIFYWQPGPGFFGTYHLVFLIKNNNGEYKRKDILINISVKFKK